MKPHAYLTRKAWFQELNQEEQILAKNFYERMRKEGYNQPSANTAAYSFVQGYRLGANTTHENAE